MGCMCVCVMRGERSLHAEVHMVQKELEGSNNNNTTNALNCFNKGFSPHAFPSGGQNRYMGLLLER